MGYNRGWRVPVSHPCGHQPAQAGPPGGGDDAELVGPLVGRCLTFLATLVRPLSVANWMKLDAIKASVERVASGLEQVRSAMVDD